jgi:hypothetical protein
MSAIAMQTPLPWYRQRWPWLLMAGPAIVVVAGFVTLWLAISSNDGLVADDYYKRGLGINRTLERSERAAALGLVAVVDLDASGAVQVMLTSTVPGLEAAPAQVRLTLLHPTRAGADRRIDLSRGPDGAYRGQAGVLPPGRWRVGVETDNWRLPTVEIEGELRAVRITAEAPR